MSKSTNLVFNGGSIHGIRDQSDWAETNPLSDSFIKNKPNIDKGRIHKIGLWEVDVSDPSPKPQSHWIIDLESPNEDEPSGYDRLTVSKAIELHENGEVFAFTSGGTDIYYESLFTSSTDYVHMTLVRSGFHQRPNEISLATIDSFGNYLGVSDAFADSEYWNVELVREGSDELKKNKIHRYSFGDATIDDETPVYGSWLIDLDKPDPNGPEGYSRVTPAEFWRTTAVNGEVPVYLQDKNSNNGLTYAYLSRADVTKSGNTVTNVFSYFVRSGYGNDLSRSYGFRFTKYPGSDYLQKASATDDLFEALSYTGNGRDVTVDFTEAQTRTNIGTGEKLSVLFGKIKKWFTDLKTLAFKEKADLTQDVNGVLPIANGGTNASTASDARTNLDVYSKAEVNNAIDTAVASAYHAAGTKTVAQLTSALLVAENQGNVYNITDSGTTTADFADGAGHPIVAGDNVGVCDVGGGVYKFDLLSGFVDLSGYLAKTGDGSDVTSTFTKASGDTSSITSGGKLSAIFTAISSFFSAIASHIANTSNPHNVTAAQTGAEPAFSILPVNKGGTGKDTVNSAANNFIYNLQLTSSDIASDACEIITGDANHTPSNLLTFYKRPVSALWAYIKKKIAGATVNVKNTDNNTETSSFTFVNGHIYHLTLYLQGSLLVIPATSSGTGYVAAYIGSSIGQSHYSCKQFVDIQRGELTTRNISLPIDWKAENIVDSSDNQLHVAVIFNGTRYGFTSVSNYELTLIGTDFNGA